MLDQGNIRDDIGVFYVTPGQLEAEWRNAAPLIRLAQKRVEHKNSMDDVYAELEAKNHQLWVVKKNGVTKAAITTMVERFPQSDVFVIMLIGGFDMQEWYDHALNVMKDAAKRLGCKTLEADCRLGWSKYAKQYGFREVTRTYELEI